MSEKGAGSSGGSPQASSVTVSDVQELIRRKEEIEAQIKANYDVLESVSVGCGAPSQRGGRPEASGPGKSGRPGRPPREVSAVGLCLPGLPRRRTCGLCRQQSVRQITWRTKNSIGIVARAQGAHPVCWALFHVLCISELI